MYISIIEIDYYNTKYHIKKFDKTKGKYCFLSLELAFQVKTIGQNKNCGFASVLQNIRLPISNS